MGWERDEWGCIDWKASGYTVVEDVWDSPYALLTEPRLKDGWLEAVGINAEEEPDEEGYVNKYMLRWNEERYRDPYCVGCYGTETGEEY